MGNNLGAVLPSALQIAECQRVHIDRRLTERHKACMGRAAVLAIVAMIALSERARADWQFTRWGMSEADLESAGKGNVVRTSGDELSDTDRVPSNIAALDAKLGDVMQAPGKMRLKSGYRADDIYMTAYYYFTERGLSTVVLVAADRKDGLETERRLEQKYGPPERQERMGRYEGEPGCIVRKRWRSQSDGNAITALNRCGSHFRVWYQPLRTNNGL